MKVDTILSFGNLDYVYQGIQRLLKSENTYESSALNELDKVYQDSIKEAGFFKNPTYLFVTKAKSSHDISKYKGVTEYCDSVLREVSPYSGIATGLVASIVTGLAFFGYKRF